MTRGGWSPNNIHLLEGMAEFAVLKLHELKAQGHNYFDRRRANVEAWWRIQAMEMLERDPTLTGRDITQMCKARYHAVHQTMMEHRACAMTQDPAIRLPEYWTAISDRPGHDRLARSSTDLQPFPADARDFTVL